MHIADALEIAREFWCICRERNCSDLATEQLAFFPWPPWKRGIAIMLPSTAALRHVSIPRQSRGLYVRSRSKRLFGVAHAAPLDVSRLKRQMGSLTRPRFQE